MKRLILFLLMFVGISSAQQDITVNGAVPYFDIGRGLVWANSGIGGVNNNFIFTPATPDSSICLQAINNDASTHLFGLTVWQTIDVRATTFVGNTGRWQQLANLTTQNLPASGTQVYFIKAAGAAHIALQIQNGAGAGTVDLIASQDTQGCGANPFQPVSALSFWEASSYYSNGGRSDGFYAQACVTNPALGSPIVGVFQGTKGIIFRSAHFSTTTAGQIDISKISNTGTTCTSVTNQSNVNLNISGPTATLIAGTCVANPVYANNAFSDQVGVNTPVTIDLTGIKVITGGAGIAIKTPAAITGTVCGTLEWSEQ